MSQTPTVALATALLGQPLEEWVRHRRTLGHSWDRMSRDLSLATNGRCAVSKELLRRHYGHISKPGPDADVGDDQRATA